ncbi:hypothetical protein SDC9_87436 [bioreactor metagenome]|uniref:Cyclase n=1 Tax=bioreactor metagenome TaxID=1076179 RepID=A0A644ZKD2_9ZZZZ
MTCVDLTFPHRGRRKHTDIETRHVALKSASTAYTGVIYHFSGDSMQGTYIDFPGHILETDDGRRADSTDLADFYRMEAAVIRLDRADRPGGVSGAELEAAWGGIPRTPAVIVNALGERGPMDIPERSVWLELDAVEWLKRTGCRLLVSDIYESRALEGVFLKLFQAGIATVCEPDQLHKLTAPVVQLTVTFVKLPVTQLPCALVAEF